MFPRAFWALRYFAARFFPQSQGDAPTAATPRPLTGTWAAPTLTGTWEARSLTGTWE